MDSGPIDPLELLKGLDCFLGQEGDIKTFDAMANIFNLMKVSENLVSRCIYLNIILQTQAPELLSKFIHVGGYDLLNNWLTNALANNNSPLLHQILLTLQHLPLTVDHLKLNNTAKLVKKLSKSSEDKELRKLARVLVSHWLTVIQTQSHLLPPKKDKKNKDAKVGSIVYKTAEASIESRVEKQGVEVEAPYPAPSKKPLPVIPKKNLQPIPIRRQGPRPSTSDAAPAERKSKPNVDDIKVNLIATQPSDPAPASTEGKPEPDSPQLTKKGKKRKTVSWPDESLLQECFIFDPDETEIVNVKKMKNFDKNAKREMLMLIAFKNAWRPINDTMEEVVPWTPPRALDLPEALVQLGSKSTEKHTQAEREMGILQEMFLSKESVPDTPHEPDPEPCDPSSPKLIPLDELDQEYQDQCPPTPVFHHQLPPLQHCPPPGPGGPYPGPLRPPGSPQMIALPPLHDDYWDPDPDMRSGHHKTMGGGCRMRGDRGYPSPLFHIYRGGRGVKPGYRGRGGRRGKRGPPPGRGRDGPHEM